MSLEETVQAYLQAWDERDDEARRKLLTSAWTDEGVYQDPTVRAPGREPLVAHIGEFHGRMPDARFELMSAIEGYASVFRFDWRLHAGGKALDGTDFGTLADDGRIASITGFFGPRDAG